MKNTSLILIILVFVVQACELQKLKTNEARDSKISEFSAIKGADPIPPTPPPPPDPNPLPPDDPNEGPCVVDLYPCTYRLTYNNTSDYIIDVYYYHKGQRYIIKHYRGNTAPVLTALGPGEQQVVPAELFGQANVEHARREKYIPFYRYMDHDICDIPKGGFYEGGMDNDSIRIYFNEGKPNERYVTYTNDGLKPRDIRAPKEYVYKDEDCWSVQDTPYYYTFTNEDYDNAGKHQNTTPTPFPECFWEEPTCCTEGTTCDTEGEGVK